MLGRLTTLLKRFLIKTGKVEDVEENDCKQVAAAEF